VMKGMGKENRRKKEMRLRYESDKLIKERG
jgi:hypothetical protein